MYNQVILIGNLTRDPELRSLPSGKSVANGAIATSKKWKDQLGDMQEHVEYHNLVVWGNAEAFCQYLQKGSKVFITGELRTRSWDKDGIKRYVTEVYVNDFKFLDSKPKTESAPVKKQEQIPTSDLGEVMTENPKDEVIKIEDIPF